MNKLGILVLVAALMVVVSAVSVSAARYCCCNDGDCVETTQDCADCDSLCASKGGKQFGSESYCVNEGTCTALCKPVDQSEWCCCDNGESIQVLNLDQCITYCGSIDDIQDYPDEDGTCEPVGQEVSGACCCYDPDTCTDTADFDECKSTCNEKVRKFVPGASCEDPGFSCDINEIPEFSTVGIIIIILVAVGVMAMVMKKKGKQQ